jgi:hypothetical protein
VSESRPYYEAVSALEHIYLEDSFVLGIHEDAQAIFFDLDVVLTEKHSSYAPPKSGERYCYCRVRLSFSGHVKPIWLKRNLSSRSTDANGEVDYGEIDIFECLEGCYRLAGSWGEVKIYCDTVRLAYR